MILQGAVIWKLLKPERTPGIAALPQSPENFALVGYYPGYKSGDGSSLQEMDLTGLTHLHYAFAGINEDLELTLRDPEQDLRNFEILHGMQQELGLKVLISVGGSNSGRYFPDAVAYRENREKFAENCVQFVVEHGLDGIDLDWEYPEKGEESSDYRKLLRELRVQLDEKARETGKYYLLSATCPMQKDALDRVDPSNLGETLDYLFLMGYDMHGRWETYTDFNAPLYPGIAESPNGDDSIRDVLLRFLRRGFPARKMILGIPFYANLYSLTQEDERGLHQPYAAAWQASYWEVRHKYLQDRSFRSYYDEYAAAPYLCDGNTFISYEDPRSLAQKVYFARILGLGGVGIWELTQDSDGELKTALTQAMFP